MKPTKQNVEAALMELGSSSDEIANNLHKLGVTGDLENTDSCPIANYLKARYDQQYREDIVVDVEEIQFGKNDCHDCDEFEKAVVSTTKYLDKFIIKFDNRKYPFLIKGE